METVVSKVDRNAFLPSPEYIKEQCELIRSGKLVIKQIRDTK
jgi:hypothetical protein